MFLWRKTTCLLGLVVLIVGSGLTRADNNTYAAEMRTRSVIRPADGDKPRENRYWVTPEYVHYWQSTTARLPELLSYTPTDTFPTGIYYGGKGITWSDGNAVRLTAGMWIDDKERYGVELIGLYMPRQTQSAGGALPGNVDAFFSDYNTSPPHTFRNFFPTDPLSSATFQYSTEQYGGEANGLYHFQDWEPATGLKIHEDALVGFRYFGLEDTYADEYTEAASGFRYTDNFKTNNNFYGANLGLRLRAEYKGFFAELTPKIALGATDETVKVGGDNAVAAVPGPGGFYASGNKVGTRSNMPFAYLPQISIKLGYNINDTVGIFVGYDALFLSEVARVENQISTNLDGDTIAGFNAGAAPDKSPTQSVQSSSLFEQGVTAGITLKL
jgi:hypothetical protein